MSQTEDSIYTPGEHEVLPAERDRMSMTGWLK